MTRLMTAIARWMAIFGGFVLLALITLTTLSIIGRSANTLGHNDFLQNVLPTLAGWLTQLGPITGDFELVEAGVAFAVMAFFPWCFVQRGHATVDAFTQLLPNRIVHFLSLLWETVFAFVMIIITWRIYIGTTNKQAYGETTFMLEFPLWWAFAAVTLAAAVATVVAVWMVLVRASDLIKGSAV